MRSIWKGSIRFGLVNIPIAVYPATKEEKVSFKQQRKKDLSPIRGLRSTARLVKPKRKTGMLGTN